MCDSKQDGGQRCGYHLTQGAGTALVAYASAVTGVRRPEVTQVYEDLHARAADAEAPTRSQVDEFLAAEDFRVRHDATLTVARRTSVSARLSRAIGRVNPDGQTFTAWKGLLAESWVRSRRRVAGAFLIGALSMGAGACGTAPATAPEAPAPTASQNTSTPVNWQSGSVEEAAIAPATFTGEAVDAFGQDRVQAGYAMAAEFTATQTFRADLLPYGASRTEADFADAGQSMTTAMRADYAAQVRGALAGDQAAYDSLTLISYSNVGSDTAPFATTGPLVTNHRVGGAHASVDRTGSTERLAMTVTDLAEFRVTSEGTAARLPVTKTVTYYLAPAPEAKGGWLIDGLNGEFRTGDFTPETDARQG